MPDKETPTKQWLHAGDELVTIGAATVRVVKTRAGECRLEVETEDIFEWRIQRQAAKAEGA